MSATALFPMYFLKSFAYAGVATVAFVATASIVITPAAIVLLGPRLDALDVRRLVRRLLGRPDPVHKPVKQLFWYRSSKFVMRRWLPVGTAVVALLVLLGLPFLSVKWVSRTTGCCRGRRRPVKSAISCAMTLATILRRRYPSSSRTLVVSARSNLTATQPSCPGCPTYPR